MRLDELPATAVRDYDRRCFPAARDAFLERWLWSPGGAGYAVPGGDGLRGYGRVRPCRNGFKIGPLFADDAATAEVLYAALAAHAGDAPLFLDVPLVNAGAVALAERHGMTPVFETARMYTRGEPSYDRGRMYGVTSFELG